ncbi:MAG: NERD domain-containing protein [Gammaproteobacteria bacterium]|nr:NERD domain-containing protein [Gammaproteobacteria bacterium]
MPFISAEVVTAERFYQVNEVTVIESDSGYMYSYRDDSGHLIVRDIPPPGYIESLTAERAKQRAVVIEPEAVSPVLVTPVKVDATNWSYPLLVVLSSLMALAALLYYFAPHYRRWRSESPLERVLRRASIPVFRDVALSAKGFPSTVIDCLAKTPAGILVISNPHLAGEIVGQPQQDFWMQNNRGDNQQIDNPIRKNNRDTRIVKLLLGDAVPIHGCIVYTGRAELSPVLQTMTERLSIFSTTLDSHMTAFPDQRSLDGKWRTLMRYPRANSCRVRARGAAWKRALCEHQRKVVSGSLLLMSMLVAIWGLRV